LTRSRQRSPRRRSWPFRTSESRSWWNATPPHTALAQCSSRRHIPSLSSADRWHPIFLHFSPFWFLCTIMPFAVSFQKMDPWLGAVIIGGRRDNAQRRQYHWRQLFLRGRRCGNWQVPGGRRHRSGRRPPWTARSGAVQGGRRQDLWRRPLELATSPAT
jgi:hypothetical protein